MSDSFRKNITDIETARISGAIVWKDGVSKKYEHMNDAIINKLRELSPLYDDSIMLFDESTAMYNLVMASVDNVIMGTTNRINALREKYE